MLYAKQRKNDHYLILIFFLCVPESAADAAAVNAKGTKTLLANGLIIFLIKGNPVFSNGPSNLLRNPPNCIIFDNWVFDNLISTDELFAKDLRRFETCLLVSKTREEDCFHYYQPLSVIILMLLLIHFLLQTLIY